LITRKQRNQFESLHAKQCDLVRVERAIGLYGLCSAETQTSMTLPRDGVLKGGEKPLPTDRTLAAIARYNPGAMLTFPGRSSSVSRLSLLALS